MSEVLVEQIAESFGKLDEFKGIDLAGGSSVVPRRHTIVRDGREVSEWELVVRSADGRRLGLAFVSDDVLGGAGWAAASEVRQHGTRI